MVKTLVGTPDPEEPPNLHDPEVHPIHKIMHLANTEAAEVLKALPQAALDLMDAQAERVRALIYTEIVRRHGRHS